MKVIPKLKKKRLNNSQQYNAQNYLLVKKAARFTRGLWGSGREFPDSYFEKTA